MDCYIRINLELEYIDIVYVDLELEVGGLEFEIGVSDGWGWSFEV